MDLKFKWVIGHIWDGAAYYSNSNDWVEYDEAGFFTDEDKERLELPEDGVWYSMKSFIRVVDAHDEDGDLKPSYINKYMKNPKKEI
jgi:hypothetical protein|tara:strand:+ start:568 stop:825 length:258 start_codon:yes stop_codon:yes gene_type:complete